MAGQPNRGMMKGVRPKNSAPPFKKGDARAREAALKSHAVRREKFARFKSLREAALALRDIPAQNAKDWPNMSNGVAAIAAMYAAAQRGDARAAHFLAQLQGEMVEKVEAKNVPVLVDDIPASGAGKDGKSGKDGAGSGPGKGSPDAPP